MPAPFVSIAHPQWYTLTVADALSLGDRVHAIEVYNTTCDETDTGAGSYMLDLLLARGKWYNAIATDDAHFRPGRIMMGCRTLSWSRRRPMSRRHYWRRSRRAIFMPARDR